MSTFVILASLLIGGTCAQLYDTDNWYGDSDWFGRDNDNWWGRGMGGAGLWNRGGGLGGARGYGRRGLGTSMGYGGWGRRDNDWFDRDIFDRDYNRGWGGWDDDMFGSGRMGYGGLGGYGRMGGYRRTGGLGRSAGRGLAGGLRQNLYGGGLFGLGTRRYY